jgi:serine protease AprX
MKNPVCRYLFFLAIAISAVIGLASAGQAAAVHPRLQSVLADAGDAEGIPIIVTFRDGMDLSRLPAGPRHQRRAELVRTLKSRAAAAQAPARSFLRDRQAGPIKDLWIINGLAVTATPETILALAARPEVESIRYDEVFPLFLPEISPSQVTGPVEPNVQQVNAPALWELGELGYAGQGVTVASMDTGVDFNHPDLGPRWRGGSNSWFDPNGEHPEVPVDVDGHGTGVMGIMVGGNAGGSVIGVAPEAQWISVKIFNDAGLAATSAIHEGFGWLLDPDGNPATDDAPDLVNNSWGFEEAPGVCDLTTRIFQADLRALKAAGIAVVFAAGNTGPNANTSVSPANYPESFAVGFLQSATTISSLSAQGPSACDGTTYPEAVAPGFNVRTADLNSSYVNLAGSSIAVPHVSGVMALLLSALPETRPEVLETVLKNSATDLGQTGPDNSYGFGLVNAQAAFNLLITPPAPVPVSPADGATGLLSTVILQWDQLPDISGNPVTNEVFLSTSPDFSQSPPLEVSLWSLPGSGALLAGVGGFLVLFGMAAGSRKGRWQVLAGSLLAALLILLVSCGGGGGGSGTPSDVNRRSLELTDLAPATTYFWKVTAVGALDARTEGPVRSFTTR